MNADEIKALAEAISQAQMTHPTQPEPEVPRERGRAALQGLTFGGADEAEAWLRSLGGEDYDTALADVRGKLEAYKGARPWEALGYEAGGVAVPAILGAVLSGGASSAAALHPLSRLARLAGVGAGEGAAYGFNAGEGGLENRLWGSGQGALYGAGGAVVGAGAMAGGGALLRSLTDYARRKFGPRASKVVEAEIQKAARDAGISVEEAVDGVANGRLLADNQTIASIARGWRAQSAEADTVLRNVYETRPQELRNETMQFVRRHMAGDGDPNVLRAQQANSAASKAAQSAEYNKAFDAMPEVPQDVRDALADALVRRPQAGKTAQEIYRAQEGKSPFFNVDDAGGVTFDRAPSLREAEIIRRGVRDNADTAFRSGSGEVGNAVKDIDRGLKAKLDEVSPELAATREKWSQIEGANKAFEAGRKALSRSADEVELEFDAIRQKGEDFVNAYRSGVYAAYKSRAATGSGKSLPRNVASEERKEGQIMRLVFPEDEIEGLVSRSNLAADAQDSANRLLGGSDTAITQGRVAEQAAGIAADGLNAANGDPTALMRIAATMVKGFKPQLSPKEAANAARLVVESNPEIVARALTDQGAMNQVYNLVEGFTRGATRVGRNEGGAVGGLLSTY